MGAGFYKFEQNTHVTFLTLKSSRIDLSRVFLEKVTIRILKAVFQW
jgi:hypothetical protein